MSNISAIILAAGKGTRMKSAKAKVLHEVAGKPMLGWVLDAAKDAGVGKSVVVVGHQSETVADFARKSGNVDIAEQSEQLGTGHAVKCACICLQGFSGTIIICCGDTPLIKGATLSNLVESHQSNKNTVTVLSAMVADPAGYGRIVRDTNGALLKIVEQKDATPVELGICEVNSGIYCVESSFLFNAVDRLTCNNSQGEYYLTDIISIAASDGVKCHAECAASIEEIMGVNDREQLAASARIMRSRINRGLMLAGVTIIDPETTYIDSAASIGNDSVIYPNCIITGHTVIGSGCTIESSVNIDASTIGDDCHIKTGSVIEESEIMASVAVGPMAHLRPGTVLHDHVKIGNFVETKKVVMKNGAKASHLTYLGDAEIGKDVNIGCGTITCNYDGVNKHRTVIGDNVFIGSDVQLVAPVTVGSNSLVAAGTTVTKDVPQDSLALSRVPQLNKEGWMLKQKGKS